MISKVDLANLFNIDGVSVEAEVSSSAYELTFKTRISGVVHEFKHKTLFSRIERSELEDLEYMKSLSDQVKSECECYFSRVKSFNLI